jgi:hypothetical protein
LCRAFPCWIAFHAIDSAFHGLAASSAQDLRSEGWGDNHEFYRSALAKPSSKFLENLIFFIYGAFESMKMQANRDGVWQKFLAYLTRWRQLSLPVQVPMAALRERLDSHDGLSISPSRFVRFV